MRIAPELPRYHYRPADKSGGGKQPDLSIQLTFGSSQRIPNVPTLALIQMGTPARLVEPAKAAKAVFREDDGDTTLLAIRSNPGNQRSDRFLVPCEPVCV